MKKKLITSNKTRLKDIKETVLDTNYYRSNIIQNTKRMRNNFAELTAVREQKFKVAKIKTWLTKISKQCAVAKCDLKAKM